MQEKKKRNKKKGQTEKNKISHSNLTISIIIVNAVGLNTPMKLSNRIKKKKKKTSLHVAYMKLSLNIKTQVG